jgi:hypothetical protein
VHLVDQATDRLGIVDRADPYEEHLTLREPGTDRTWDVPYMQIRYATTAESMQIAAMEDA